MTPARTLHVRCATWEQVEVFTTRKLRKGKLLSMKVPFLGVAGAGVTLGLELPNQLLIAIDGIIQRTSPVEAEAAAPDVQRSWIEIELTGLTDEVLARIRALASGLPDETDPPIEPAAPERRSVTSIPEDRPADERELFQQLTGELRRLRQAAVHEVIGVARDAGPDEIRASWKALLRRHHPDLVARRGSPAISHLAEELTILSNRAYDRLRAALVAEGRATLVGPSVAAPTGWLVGFDDIQSADTPAAAASPPPSTAKQYARAASPVPMATPPPRAAASAAGQGSDAFEQRARAMLGTGDAGGAREVLASALVVYPRSKVLRSLYYVATALAALLDGEVVLAQSQLEAALAHHEQCAEAALMLEHIRKHGTGEAEALRRVFQ